MISTPPAASSGRPTLALLRFTASHGLPCPIGPLWDRIRSGNATERDRGAAAVCPVGQAAARLLRRGYTPGLSSVQNSSHSPNPHDSRKLLTRAIGGNYVKIKLPGDKARRTRGDRAEIAGFTPRSRRALLNLVNSFNSGQVDRERIWFLTLTYPRAYPSARASKRHLNAFRSRLDRRYPDVCGIWKLEPQRRGAPHYHLLVVVPRAMAENPGSVRAMQSWLSRAWYEVVGSGDERHLRAGTEVRVCRSWNGVRSYAAKYLGKPTSSGDPDAWTAPGRYWGVHRRELLPIQLETRELSDRQAVTIRRQLRRYYQSQHSGRWVVTDPESGRVKFRGYADREQVASLRKLLAGCSFHQLRRRWRASRGGMSLYAPAAVVDAILQHATATVAKSSIHSSTIKQP